MLELTDRERDEIAGHLKQARDALKYDLDHAEANTHIELALALLGEEELEDS